MRTILLPVIAVCAAGGVLALVAVIARVRMQSEDAAPAPSSVTATAAHPTESRAPATRPSSNRLPAIVLPASEARLHGAVLKLHATGPGAEQEIAYWTDPQGYIEWPLNCTRAGKFNVELTFACAPGSGGSYVLCAGRDKLTAHSDSTGGWQAYRTVKLGTVSLAQEQTTLSIKPNGGIHNALMNVRRVRLVPIP